jgi:D-alanyl-D-alanine carboxypeptidase/D-alanyl-D-alanine-endopeptidase (penicillin-binding protein 4)
MSFLSRFKLPIMQLACICVLFTRAVSAQDTGVLPDSVQRILDGHDINPDSFSVVVQRVDASEPLLAVNADTLRNPASTMKLLTTFVALESLGPNYRWLTEAYLGGPLADGTLDGDLYIKGYGDPYMVVERFWLFLRQLRQYGLLNIDGDFVIDNSYFDMPTIDRGRFDGQPLRTYNVVPDAFLVNFQAISFIFNPDPVTNRVEIIADPLPVNLDIRNRIELVDGRCGGFQNGIVIDTGDSAELDRITFSGQIGSRCPEYRLSRALLNAPTFAYGVFRDLWEESGSSLNGTLRVGEVPETLEPFYVMESLPLSDIIRSINKWSNNVMARHLLLTVGVERFGAPATVDKGRLAAEQLLGERGLDFPGLWIDNGAGLSREARITAQNMAQLLLAADQSIYRAEFVSSLALAGMDGTMRRRFRNESLAGHMHLKTGRLDDVFSMVGYVRSRSGDDYVVVAIQNGTDAHRGPGEEAQSTLLKWVYEQ